MNQAPDQIKPDKCETLLAKTPSMTLEDILVDLPRGSERTDKIREAWARLNQAMNRIPPAEQAERHQLSGKMAELMAAELRDAGYKVELSNVVDSSPAFDGVIIKILDAPTLDTTVSGILQGVQRNLKTDMAIFPTYQAATPFYGAVFVTLDNGSRFVALPFQRIVSDDVRTMFLNDGTLHEIRHAATVRGLEMGKPSPYYIRATAAPGKKISNVEGYYESFGFDEMATYGKEVHQLLAGVPEMLGRDVTEMAVQRYLTLLGIATASHNLVDDALKSAKDVPHAVQFEMDRDVNRIMATVELRDEKGDVYGNLKAHLIAAKGTTDRDTNLRLLDGYLNEARKVAEGHFNDARQALEAYLKSIKP